MELEEDTESKFNPDETDVKQNEPMLNVQFIKCEQQAVMHEEIEDNYNLSSLECVDIKEEYDQSLENAEVLTADTKDEAVFAEKENNHFAQQTQDLKHQEYFKDLKEVTVDGDYMFCYPCEVCGKFELNIKCLHMGGCFPCSKCEETFIREKNAHIRHHRGENFTCEVCHKSFSLKSHRSHMSFHRGDRFPCEFCEKSFSRKSRLNEHLSIHTGVCFSCDICGQSFSLKSYLKRHMQFHKGDQFPCDVCGKSFVRKSSLNQHLEVHSGDCFSCDICGKSFSLKKSLRTHMHFHRGVCFPCDVCGKSFSRKTRLKDHLRVHAGDSVSCDICGKSFSLMRTLRKHVMKFHKGITAAPSCV